MWHSQDYLLKLLNYEQFPNYITNKIKLDNADEFTSQAFNDYCMSIGITIEHHVAHIHTQNSLAKLSIKHL